MNYKGVKLNGLLLLLLVLAMIGVFLYSGSMGLEGTTSEVLENVASANNVTKVIWWTSALIPLLFFSIYFVVRRILYKGGSLIAYATNAGVLASVFAFLDLVRIPTVNYFLAKRYLEASVFQKGMIELIYEVMNEYFFYIGEIFAPLMFNIWLLFVGILIVKTSALKRALGFVVIFVTLVGFANLIFVNSVLILVYNICLWFVLFLVALALLLF